MHIEESNEEDSGLGADESNSVMEVGVDCGGGALVSDSGSKKRALVGVGAQFLFYPTLLYNIARNRMEPEFHWWDEVDEFLLLGAVPFPSDVPHLKELGVHGVVTLNEPYETLVPVSLYHAHEIENLLIPTRDYLFAPSLGDICQAVVFIHENASYGKTTYVHCKAGRGRSTTVVLCYLVQYKQMTPITAYEYVKLRRPRVHLAPSQWKVVQEYYCLKVMKIGRSSYIENPFTKMPSVITTKSIMTYDDSAFVVISETDLDGYDRSKKSVVGNDMWVELSVVYRMQFTGQIALARFTHFWFHRNASKKVTAACGGLARESRSLKASTDNLVCG